MFDLLLESNLRRSLLVFGGDVSGFFTRPISGTLLLIFVVVALSPVIQSALVKRRQRSADRVTADS